MPRPRTHGEETTAALVAAAERIIAAHGPDALSVRTVAAAVGTSTRAVYSVFGSKGGLVAALAGKAFLVLRDELDRLEVTDDPVRDLVEVGATAYRGFVLEHPSLYRVAFQRAIPGLILTDDLLAARAEGFGRLEWRMARVQAAGLLADRDVRAAAVEFNAMCEGLANAELRGGTLRVLPRGQEVRVWRDAFTTVMRGLTAGR